MTPEEEKRELSELKEALKRAEESIERLERERKETREKRIELFTHKPGSDQCFCDQCSEIRMAKLGYK